MIYLLQLHEEDRTRIYTVLLAHNHKHKHKHKHRHKHMCNQVKTQGQHKHKHKKNGQVRSSCARSYAYVVALTSENWVDTSTSISTRPWTNHSSLTQTSCEHIKSNMADASSAILFIIGLRRAGIKN